LLGLIPVLFQDLDAIRENGFFRGYDAVVVGVIVCQAMTRLLVGFVMKYADTILKGFATSVAVVLATVLSIFIWNARVDGWFVVGAAMVMLAVRLYSEYPPGAETHKVGKLNRTNTLRLMSFAGASVFAVQTIVLRPDTLQESLEYVNQTPLEIALPNKQTTGVPIDANDMQCKIRNISRFPKWVSLINNGTSTERWAHCLRFQCLNNHTTCDTQESTNFDGPGPPCCVHILRDMAREFDRAMCHLGLEYFPAFGMLLGLVRADKLIPWTIDNDCIMMQDVLSAMRELWHIADNLNHGLGFHVDMLYRLCATPTFADGKLARWKVNETESYYPYSVCPFADIFSVKQVNETHLMDSRQCYHAITDMQPTVRRPVYNGTFYQQFPKIPEPVLVEFFGKSWRTPDGRKRPHGGTHCGRQRAWHKVHKRRQQRRRDAAAKREVQGSVADANCSTAPEIHTETPVKEQSTPQLSEFCPHCMFNPCTMRGVTCLARAEFTATKNNIALEDSKQWVMQVEPVNCKN